MEQQSENNRTSLLWELLANPADKDTSHTHNLQQLVNDFPQSGLLRALLVCTTDGENLQQAAVYYDPAILYKLNKDPETLPVVNTGQIIQPANLISGAYFHSEEHNDELLLAPWTDGYDVETEEAEHNYSLSAVTEAEELPALVPDTGFETEHTQATDELQIDANAPVVETQPQAPAANDIAKEPLTEEDNIVEPLIILENEESPISESIDDEIYDEIVGIDDINLANKDQESDAGNRAAEEVAVGNSVAEQATHTDESIADDTKGQKDGTVFNHRKVDLTDEAEMLILNNIAATDFFVFNEALGDKNKTEPAPQTPVEDAPVLETGNSKTEAAGNNVSKYNDEKMPYSFMWWLDKTRKEHAGIYQPFVETKPETSQTQTIARRAPDELQQQYYENIFHLTSVEELERSTGQKPFEFGAKRREDEIIERFIQEVPQIKPQSGDKLGNENKAKKSSEDQDELVTETLAQIYIDQMLYPKAIATYKKLVLKFPEKSRYFASQIEQLEKRTN